MTTMPLLTKSSIFKRGISLLSRPRLKMVGGVASCWMRREDRRADTFSQAISCVCSDDVHNASFLAYVLILFSECSRFWCLRILILGQSVPPVPNAWMNIHSTNPHFNSSALRITAD